jgi:hypothetical protein
VIYASRSRSSEGVNYGLDEELLDTTSVTTMQVIMGESYDHRLERH